MGTIIFLLVIAGAMAVVVLVAAVIVAVVLMFLMPGRGVSIIQETSLETLRARYARGEISREQYELMRQNLEA